MESLSQARGKVCGTAIDAYCASLQASCEKVDSSLSYCHTVFSSWLTCLVSGEVKGKGLGTIEGHITAAAESLAGGK
jgi:hypothetical protein